MQELVSSWLPSVSVVVTGEFFHLVGRFVLPMVIRTKRRRAAAAAAARCRSNLSSASRMMSDGLTFEQRLDADGVLEVERSDPAGSTEDDRRDSGVSRRLGVESGPDAGVEEADVRQEVLVIAGWAIGRSSVEKCLMAVLDGVPGAWWSSSRRYEAGAVPLIDTGLLTSSRPARRRAV